LEIAKVSTAKRKRYGDRGSPCLTPFSRVKQSNVTPLFITQLEIF